MAYYTILLRTPLSKTRSQTRSQIENVRSKRISYRYRREHEREKTSSVW